MFVRLADLAERSSWWELAGHETSSLREAWRLCHHAAQPAAELAKAFGIPEADDSHSAMQWIPGRRIIDGYFRGRLVETPRGVVCTALRPFDLSLFLIKPNGDLYAEMPLEGKTIEQAHGWVLTTTMNLFDVPVRQATEAPPDLPPHPAGSGEKIQSPNQLALIEVVRLYENTASLLEAFGSDSASSGDASDAAGQTAVLCWPHHFDLARLFVLARDAAGEMTHTIGVGLTPPDELEPAGYWYVSPWVRSDQPAASVAEVPMEHGYWHRRDGQPPMAVLPITALAGIEDQQRQHQLVLEFVTAAFNSCVAAH